MARFKYYDGTAGEWKYADMVAEIPFPNGTNDGDIPIWDATNGEWTVGSVMQTSSSEPSAPVEGMLWVDTNDNTIDVPNGNNLSY